MPVLNFRSAGRAPRRAWILPILGSAALLAAIACGQEGLSGRPDAKVDTWSANGRCLVDADCGEAHACALGVCVEGCHSDEECSDLPEDQRTCDPHGRCGTPERSRSPVSVATIGDATQAGTVVLRLSHGGERPTWVRVVGHAEGVTYDPSPLLLAPGESQDLPVEMSDAFVEGGGAVVLRVISDGGSQLVPLGTQDVSNGRWRGSISFGESPSLGRSTIELNLELVDDGTIVGQTIHQQSPMWPRDVVVHGTWNEMGEWTLEIGDIVPADPSEALEGDADLVGPSIGRPVGRLVTAQGVLDESGTFHAPVLETITGLDFAAIAIPGELVLRRIGNSQPSPAAVDERALLPLEPPPLGDSETLDQARCDGLGEDFATLDQIGGKALLACEQCLATECASEYLEVCMLALLEHGDHLSEVLDAQLDPDTPDASVEPDAWIECKDGEDGAFNPCVDSRVLGCAGAMLRHARREGNVGEELALRILDLDLQEISASSLLMLSDVSDAGLSWIQDPTQAIETELARVRKAGSRGTDLVPQLLSADRLSMLDEVGSDVLREQRSGRDLGELAGLLGLLAEVRAQEIDLRRRSGSDDETTRRRQLAWTMVYAHLHAAGVAHRIAVHEISDGGDDLASVAALVEDAQTRYRELELGTNAVGLPADDVPLLLSTEAADAGITNFELVASKAALAVGEFEQASNAAVQTLQAYQDALYSSQERAAQVAESYDAQLISLCGSSPTDPASPDLAHCGQDGGLIQELTLRLQASDLQIEQAALALDNNHQAILIQEDKLRELLVEFELLDATVAKQQDILMVARQDSFEVESVARWDRADADCARIRADSAIDVTAIMVGAIINGTTINPFDLPRELGSAGVEVVANKAHAAVACNHAQELAGIDDGAALAQHLIGESMAVANAEIDSALRESQAAQTRIELLAQVKTMALANGALTLGIAQAEKDREIAVASLFDALAQVASLRERRERALKRLEGDPSNPYRNPTFLVMRIELARELLAQRENALRWLWRAGRALELEIVRDLGGLDESLLRARTPAQLNKHQSCLQHIFDEYVLEFGGAQQHVLEVSLRRDILGLKNSVFDPVTGAEVTPAEQFRAILQQPDVLDADGTVHLAFALPLEGDGVLTASVLCEDRITGVQASLAGDYLGDGNALVLVGRSGQGRMRRCDASAQTPDDQIQSFVLDDRRAAVQAGTNDWGQALPNSQLAGWPTAGERWTVEIPSGAVAPENADLDLEHLDDIRLRWTRRAGTVSTATAPSVFACAE